MDIFFQDPTEIPLPPEDVRIHGLTAEVWPDGQRVRVTLEIDPFQKRPSADLMISDRAGIPLANASVIESMTRRVELTMHLRNAPAPGTYYLEAALYYLAPLPEKSEKLELSPPQVVDHKQIEFQIPAIES